jgi:hypothetical protein
VYNIADAKIIPRGVLRVDDRRIVVKATFGEDEQVRVLKISPSAGPFVKANVLAGQWIHRLELAKVLEGVGAPEEMENCDLTKDGLNQFLEQISDQTVRGELRKRLDEVERGKNPHESTAAMVSTLVQGTTVYTLLGKLHVDAQVNSSQGNAFQNVIYQKVLNDYPKNGPAPEATFINKKLQEASRLWGRLHKKGNLTNDQSFPGDLDQLVDGLPVKTSTDDKAKFELQVLLARRFRARAPLAYHAVVEVADSKAQTLANYQAWLDTDKGTKAFIRMAAVDVIVGMVDRVLTILNTENFMFNGNSEPPHLVCMDNAKGKCSLDFSQDAYEQWVRNNLKPTLVGGLAKTLEEHLKAMGCNGTRVTPPYVGEILLAVATGAGNVASSRDKDKPGAAQIRDRAQYVLKRLQEEGFSKPATTKREKLEATLALQRSGGAPSGPPTPRNQPNSLLSTSASSSATGQRNGPRTPLLIGAAKRAKNTVPVPLGSPRSAPQSSPSTSDPPGQGPYAEPEDTLDDAGRPILTSAMLASLPSSAATTPPVPNPLSHAATPNTPEIDVSKELTGESEDEQSPTPSSASSASTPSSPPGPGASSPREPLRQSRNQHKSPPSTSNEGPPPNQSSKRN